MGLAIFDGVLLGVCILDATGKTLKIMVVR
jgi:hypothetical protein